MGDDARRTCPGCATVPASGRRCFRAVCAVEVAGGLVSQHAGRLGHQRARQRHPLPLAAGQFARLVRRPAAPGRPAPAWPLRRTAPARAACGGSAAASRRCRARRIPAAGDGTGRRSPAIRCAAGPRAASHSDAKSRPSRVTLPALGVSRPPSRCNSVLLPEPEAPTMATRSPRCTSRSMPGSTRPSIFPAYRSCPGRGRTDRLRVIGWRRRLSVVALFIMLIRIAALRPAAPAPRAS